MSKIINKHPGNKKYNAGKGRKRITFNVKEDFATLDADKEIKKVWKRMCKS
jgi:hypothetical protein